MSTWRERAARVIEAVFRAHPDADEPAMRRHLREAYPFGERAGWPYTAWLSETHRRLGERYRHDPPSPPPRSSPGEARAQREAEGQLTLGEEAGP